MNKTNKLTIVGGGITGLSAAYIAVKNGWKVTLLEALDEPGGLLRTFGIGGTQLECFYHHYFTHDKEFIWLCKELGLEDKLFFTKTSTGVFRNGKIFKFSSPLDLVKFAPFSFLDKVRFGLTSYYLGKISDWSKLENTGALDWLKKYSGKNVTEVLWKPLIEAKFGPYAKDVPISWMVGRLSQRMRSREGKDEKLGYIDGSIKVLTNKLVEALRNNNAEIVSNAAVNALDIEDNKLQAVYTLAKTYSGGLFLFTTPNNVLSKLLIECGNDYGKELDKIKYFGAVCVILETKKKYSGTYWLNIADPGFPFVGVIEHTNFVGPKHYNGSHIVYLTKYFSENDFLATASDKQIQDVMTGQLHKVLSGFSEKDLINIYTFKTLSAATVCDLDFSKKIPNCKSPVQNLYIANIAHVYPDERSCNNSIRIAAQACRVLGMNTDFIPNSTSLAGKIGMSL